MVSKRQEMRGRGSTRRTVKHSCDHKAKNEGAQGQGEPIEEGDDENEGCTNHGERHQKHSVRIRQEIVHGIDIFRKTIDNSSKRSRVEERHWRADDSINSLQLGNANRPQIPVYEDSLQLCYQSL